MSRYRKVEIRIWNDEKFRSFSDREKLAFLYLLTHPNMTALGAMRNTPQGLAAELGWLTEEFVNAFEKALRHGMVLYDHEASLMALPNFLKYNKPESPNVVKAWASAVDLLPECDLKLKVIDCARKTAKGMSEGFQQAFASRFDEP